MTGINHKQFLTHIIKPSLEYMNMWCVSSEQLLLGTAIQESGLGRYLKQIGGPALGIYQIEPNTHQDIWNHYIKRKTFMFDKLIYLYPQCKEKLINELLVYDLRYATIIARLIYYRRPEQLPKFNDIVSHAHYWKNHYNTHLGKGKWSSFIRNYKKGIKD